MGSFIRGSSAGKQEICPETEQAQRYTNTLKDLITLRQQVAETRAKRCSRRRPTLRKPLCGRNSRLSKYYKSDVGTRKAVNNFGKSSFFHKTNRLLGIKPPCLPLAFLRPFIKLSFHTKQKDAHLADSIPVGEPLRVVKVTKRSLAHDVAN